MICPNCGRRNSAGATFCSRCHQRLPLANRVGGQRRVVIAEPRGGGGSGAIVLGVALLAGFLFIGGAAAIYLSNPPATPDPTDIAIASGSPTLPPFVQPTATPSPTPTPSFILLPSDSPSFGSFSPLPTDSGFPSIPPTSGPPTSTPVPVPVVNVKFACGQIGTKKQIGCGDNSTGPIASRKWDFGDNRGTSTDRTPVYTYDAYGTYTVTLLITGTDGKQYFKQKVFTLQPPATPTPTPPDATPTPTPPDASPTPTPSSTATATMVAADATDIPHPTESPAP